MHMESCPDATRPWEPGTDGTRRGWPPLPRGIRSGLAGAVLAGAACGTAFSRDAAPPCVSWVPPGLQPLLVGEVAQLRVGREHGSDCMYARPVPLDAVTWRTADGARVRVTPRGEVRGLAPGVFRVHAAVEGRELHASGFVLPRGWGVRVEPGAFDVRVGDTVQLRVRAVTSDGAPLPAVPSTLVTPEYLAWGRELLPDLKAGRPTRPPEERGGLFDREFFQSEHGHEPGVFVARRAGTTFLVGAIGARADTVRVIVRPAARTE